MNSHDSWWKELLAALVGALITTTLQLFFTLKSAKPGEDINWQLQVQPLVLSGITGAIIGWIYRTANNLRKVAEEALTRLETATRALEFQEEPLKMLTLTKRHAETLGRLLSDSMKDKYKYISYVDENKYLSYLQSAISESKKYEGVQRFPVRWFKATNNRMAGEAYLHELREQKMKEKTRIFLIDEEDIQAMKEDLENNELMKFYWANTGIDVKTYWTTTSELRRFYNRQLEVPNDFALYDEELLIEYDSSTQTLFFEIIEANDKRREIFKKLAIQEKNKSAAPLIKIEPPK